jgi:hypothetical protein
LKARENASAFQRDGHDAVAAERELLRGTFQATQLDVAVHADAKAFGELPVEMIFRESGNAAELFHAQVFIQVRVDVFQHFAEAFVISVCGRRIHGSIS